MEHQVPLRSLSTAHGTVVMFHRRGSLHWIRATGQHCLLAAAVAVHVVVRFCVLQREWNDAWTGVDWVVSVLVLLIVESVHKSRTRC